MIPPEWTWFLEDADGAHIDVHTPVLATQLDAEEWLGLRWRELAASGTARASLMHRGRQATPTLDLVAALRAGEGW
ncbi:MAG: hypothetical protein ACTMIR_12560 [Cellulomonadaceae bacterium]